MIAQLSYFTQSSFTPPTFTSGWSENLIAGKKVTELGIYALPGTKFAVNQKGNDENLIINGSGIFNLTFGDRPITELYLSEDSYNLCKNSSHFIVIDLIYEEVV